jgi:uncharacterized protein YukE
MSEEVYMDVPAVRGIAQRFGQMGETLQGVSKALQAAITVLKTSAFIGLFGSYALATYLEQIEPVITEYAEKCVEMNQDLDASATAYENGDRQGSTRFH